MNQLQRLEAKIDALTELVARLVGEHPPTAGGVTRSGPHLFSPGTGLVIEGTAPNPHADCPPPCDGHGNHIHDDGVTPNACPGTQPATQGANQQ